MPLTFRKLSKTSMSSWSKYTNAAKAHTVLAIACAPFNRLVAAMALKRG